MQAAGRSRELPTPRLSRCSDKYGDYCSNAQMHSAASLSHGRRCWVSQDGLMAHGNRGSWVRGKLRRARVVVPSSIPVQRWKGRPDWEGTGGCDMQGELLSMGQLRADVIPSSVDGMESHRYKAAAAQQREPASLSMAILRGKADVMSEKMGASPAPPHSERRAMHEP